MIATLSGTVHRMHPGTVIVDVHGVGYRVTVPLDVWETLEEGATTHLWVSSYIREDRFDLYGFLDRAGLRLFEELISKQGIGPKLGLELCSVPRNLLLQALRDDDASVLTSIKGIGRKTAEKLLLELQSLLEKDPQLFGETRDGGTSAAGSADQDVMAALRNLGYDTPTVLKALKELPKDLKTTEERVAAALRSL